MLNRLGVVTRHRYTRHNRRRCCLCCCGHRLHTLVLLITVCAPNFVADTINGDQDSHNYHNDDHNRNNPLVIIIIIIVAY